MKLYICADQSAYRMNRFCLIALLFAGLLFTACIPNKDLVYLQGEPSQTPAVNPVSLKPYRVQVSDILSVTIKSDQKEIADFFQPTNNSINTGTGRSEASNYFDGFAVDDHGNIRIPILEEINVLGFTLDEIRQTIEKKLLEDFFTEQANFFVTVKLSGFRYTINGEVASPGTKTLYQEKVTILDAMANAGDITFTGDRKSVVLIRQMPQGTEMHTLDLTKRDLLQSPFYYLQPNDYIYVKPLPQKSLGTGQTAAQSLTTIISVLSLLTTLTVLITR